MLGSFMDCTKMWHRDHYGVESMLWHDCLYNVQQFHLVFSTLLLALLLLLYILGQLALSQAIRFCRLDFDP